ncbi:MAG TPA: hypothetical protein VHR41_17910 [Gemmatimonadales bacterium]|nr:hypothetical protein [Gemmatimonadales bacterium]
MTLTLPDLGVSDLAAFAGGQGHPNFPCLSRTHSPSSCVPCVDFSPWLRERVGSNDAEAVGEYLWHVRQANPGVGETSEYLRAQYHGLGQALVAAELDTYLTGGTAEAYLDLKVALIMLAVHETFSGFVMTGEGGDFLASVMAAHALTLRSADVLVARRNAFVTEMGREMSFWSSWPPLDPDSLISPVPPENEPLGEILAALATLPLGTRAHAVDALRHLSAEARVPRTLASLSRYDTRKRGLDVADSTNRILATGVVIPATDLEAWLGGWTRRDLLGFLRHAGVGARNSWTKERLAEVAQNDHADVLRGRMADSGAVELAPNYAEGARQLRQYVEAGRDTWSVWLGFATGVSSVF